MAEGQRKNWRELCNAALEAKDPDELLMILQELNRALKHEEQIRRDFREAARTSTTPVKPDISSYWESRETSVYVEHQLEDTNEGQENPLR
jgi:hypothetical protein